MSGKMKERKPNFLISFAVAVVLLSVIIAVRLLLTAISLPFWPFLFSLFYYVTFAKMEREKLIPTVVGGFIGMLVSFLEPVVTMVTGSELYGLIAFVVAIILMMASIIDGRVKIIDDFCMLIVTCATSFAGATPVSGFLPAVGTYLIAAIVFSATIIGLDKRKSKMSAGSAAVGEQLPESR